MKFSWLIVCVTSLSLGTAYADTSEKYVYEQKAVGVKEKPVRVKIAISRFEPSLEIQDSLFNPQKQGTNEKNEAKTINVKVDDALAVLEAENRKEDKYSDADLLVGLLTDKLKRSNFFDVVERQDINQIIREINFEKSNWVKQDNVNKLVNISGIQYLVSGKLLMNRDGHRVGSSRYMLSLRLYNVNTGETLATSTGEHENLEGVVEEAVKNMTGEIHSLPWTCRIAKVEGGIAFINAGFSDNLQKGYVFSIIKIGESIKDPVTQSTLGFNKEEIGKVRIEEILENNLSKVKIISQKKALAVGDIVSAKAPNLRTDEIKKWNEIFK